VLAIPKTIKFFKLQSVMLGIRFETQCSSSRSSCSTTTGTRIFGSLKALAVNRAGHPADLGCILA